MMMKTDIAIIGGGINGLSIGWRLARAGRRVTVVERDRAGRGATWAAAGMLAAKVEAEHGEEWLLPLLLEGRAMWAQFAREIEAESGVSAGYRGEGTMVVAVERDHREKLEHRYDYLTKLGLQIEWLSGDEARRKEPHLARSASGAIFSRLDHQVDNRAAIDGIRLAFERAGGVLIENTEVSEIVLEGGRAAGLRLGESEIAADCIVLAAGAWSRNLPGLPEAARPPVRPVKGQMLAVQMDPRAPLIRHVVWTPDIYLCPRLDGRLIVGATVEEMGFDTTMTAGGVYELLRRGREALPGIYDLPLIETWAGLRPTSRDDAPILGPGGVDGLVMATGHHRNGILLAPVTADGVSRYILTGELTDSLRPFTLDRFRRPEAATAA